MNNLYELSTVEESFLSNKISIGRWHIHYDNASVYHNKNIAILGEFLHIDNPEINEQRIINEYFDSLSFNEVLNTSKFLLGRYVIFFVENDGSIKVIPDSTATIPVNYLMKTRNTFVSSDTNYMKNKFNLSLSEVSLSIKSATENQQPLPYNLTMYDEIRTVIPNHYFDSNKNKMVRYYPITEVEDVSLEHAVDETIKIIDKVLPTLLKNKKLSLPLTAGIDSRTVLAFLKTYITDIPVYTFYNNDESSDLKVAKELSKNFGFSHYGFKRVNLSEKEVRYFKDIMDGNHNINILRNGATLKKTFLNDYSFVAGDIIPLAKSNFGKNLPEGLATTSYFTTKTHNYSKENKLYVRKWLEDTKQYNAISIYDLFFWEYRFGRWLPNNAANYDQFTEPLYLFNCRYLIELWLSVPRKVRHKRSLHKEIIKLKWPELMDIPINPGNKIIDRLISNQYIFYLGSFVKYYVQQIRK